MRIGSLFSGYGGLDMGVQAVLGGTVAWHCEYDAAPSRILAHHWPDVPNLGDVTTVDWSAVEPVDVLTGGYPCQPFSHAGLRKGTDDPRHLWPHMLRAIRLLRPSLVVAENVRGHLGLGFAQVLAEFAAIGFDAEWVVARASDVGAPHRRERLFIAARPAHADGQGGAPAGPAAEGHRGVGMTLLPTPKASDGPHAGPSMVNGRGVPDALPGVVGALLPTPTAADAKASGGAAYNGANVTLTDAAVRLGRFGEYAPAVARWEAVLGRPAPDPTEPNPRTGRPRLSPLLVEFMMGLPAGHVTGVPGLSYAAQLKALGNGVVPQQAAHALRMLLGLPAAGVSGGGALLPTPAVNDMGAGKTPPVWDEWTARMKTSHGNGNGHGASLSIEAQRLAGC